MVNQESQALHSVQNNGNLSILYLFIHGWRKLGGLANSRQIAPNAQSAQNNNQTQSFVSEDALAAISTESLSFLFILYLKFLIFFFQVLAHQA